MLDNCGEKAEFTFEDKETLREIPICQEHFDIIEGICAVCGKNRVHREYGECK